MRVTSVVVIVSSLSSFYYCNAESTPNKNRVVHQNNNEEEAYTLYPDLNEERPSRRQLQDKSMATASPSYYPTLSPTFESMSMQAAARNAEDQHDAAMLNVNPPKKKAAPKKKNAPKSSLVKPNLGNVVDVVDEDAGGLADQVSHPNHASHPSLVRVAEVVVALSNQQMMPVSAAVLTEIPMDMILKTAQFKLI